MNTLHAILIIYIYNIQYAIGHMTMYIYIYLCIYTNIYICIIQHTHIHTYTHIYIHIHSSTCVYSICDMYIYIHTYIMYIHVLHLNMCLMSRALGPWHLILSPPRFVGFERQLHQQPWTAGESHWAKCLGGTNRHRRSKHVGTAGWNMIGLSIFHCSNTLVSLVQLLETACFGKSCSTQSTALIDAFVFATWSACQHL